MSRGGVGFLLKNGLYYNERDDLSIWIEGKVEVFSIEIDGRKNIISMVYKPPSAHQEEFVGGTSQLISKVHWSQSYCYG
jgi:hypothetical protein